MKAKENHVWHGWHLKWYEDSFKTMPLFSILCNIIAFLLESPLKKEIQTYNVCISIRATICSSCNIASSSQTLNIIGECDLKFMVIICSLYLSKVWEKKYKYKIWFAFMDKNGVLRKVTSQGDLITNSYLGRSWRAVTPQTCNFFRKRCLFALSRPRSLYPCMKVNTTGKCPLSGSSL